MSEESAKEEILVNVSPSEVRAALLENGILQEVFVERAARRGLISNIYKGKVSRVLPGMQAAFVDIGLERTAFLHADVYDCSLHTGQHARDSAFVNVANDAAARRALDMHFLQDAVLEQRGTHLTRRDVDQDLFFW